MLRLVILLLGLALLGNPAPHHALAANCTFQLGFKTLHDMIPDIVGECLVDEHHNAENGDGLQETLTPKGVQGLMVWRKADNWTAFTDGARTWINGPLGLQSRLNTVRFTWEGDAAPGAIAPVAPVTPAAPAPPPAPAAPSASAGSAAGRFGVIMSNTDPGVVQRVLGQLGMRWWFSFFDDTRTAPGTQRVLLISTADAAPLKSAAELQAMARQNPGAHWLIGNEPNTPGQDNVTPARYAERLRYYADALRGIDPAAKLVGPNVLNWNRTCTGCDGGFTPGKQWTEQLAASYQERYGSSPPFDVWGVHAYTISWDRLPMTDPGAMIEEVSAFRSFVDSRQGDRAKPVWVTEFGVIWGYDQVAWRDGKVSPAGDLRNDRVQEYLTQFVGWLKDNAERRNIERWFLFISHGAAEPYATDYAGISLMTTGGADAELTPLGQTYRRLAGAP